MEFCIYVDALHMEISSALLQASMFFLVARDIFSALPSLIYPSHFRRSTVSGV